MESPGDTYWMSQQCVYSPTESGVYSPGSDDSGVGLSPEDCNYDSIFRNGLSSPESPSSYNIPSQISNFNVYDTNDGYPPNHLTPDELDALSDSCGLSPASVDQHLNTIQDLDDLLNCPQQQENCVGPSDNTQRRRDRQKQRDLDLYKSHPHVPPCLVPKSGTAKPRQSRKRRKSPSTTSMTVGQGKNMNERNCYVGARVKQTAKQRLDEIRRNKRQNTSQAEILEHTIKSNPSIAQSYEPMPKRRHPIICDQRVPTHQDRVHPTSVIAQPHPDYGHRVVLQPRRTADELEMCITKLLAIGDAMPLHEYAQRHAHACNLERSTKSPLEHLLQKLNEKKEAYSVANMQKIAEFLCKTFSECVNSENFDGETLIYQAALHGNEGVVLALMNCHADPWIRENKGGQSALHAAVRSKKPRVVNAILENSKEESKRSLDSINVPSHDGNTPLHVATALTELSADAKKEIIIKLLEYGADTTKKNHMNQMPHSFLVNDPKMKELQNEMKRLSQRKKSIPTPVASMGPGHHVTRHPGMYTAPYHHHQEQSVQTIHPNANYSQPCGCGPIQYENRHYAPISQSSIPQLQQNTCTSPQPVYYGHHAAPVPPYTAAGNDIEEFLNLNHYPQAGYQ